MKPFSFRIDCREETIEEVEEETESYKGKNDQLKEKVQFKYSFPVLLIMELDIIAEPLPEDPKERALQDTSQTIQGI